MKIQVCGSKFGQETFVFGLGLIKEMFLDFFVTPEVIFLRVDHLSLGKIKTLIFLK